MVQDIDNDGLNEFVCVGAKRINGEISHAVVQAFDTPAVAPTPRARTENQFYSARRNSAAIYVPPIGNDSRNRPPEILNDTQPPNGAESIVRPPAELAATVEDLDADMMDIQIRWRQNDYYHYGEWITLQTYSGVSNGTYNYVPLAENNWIWGNTTYFWSVNVTDGFIWTNETFQYFTNSSRYDVDNDKKVTFRDSGLVWMYRTSEADYEGIYDVNQDGEVNLQDSGLTWINRD
jgi:hypothetical protein